MDNKHEITNESLFEMKQAPSDPITVSVNSKGSATEDDISPDAETDEFIDEAVDSAPSDELPVDESPVSWKDALLHKWKRLSRAKKAGCLSCSTVLFLFLLLIITVTSVFLHYYNLMDIDDNNDIVIKDNVTFSDAELSEIPDGEVNLEKSDIFKDKSVFNIMLIGTDERCEEFSDNARADSIMLLSLDNKHKVIRLVSLERGMLVKIPGRKNDILTHTFRYGGANLLMETVRTHLNVDVDKYVRVNFEMFQKLVDEVGGVDLVLTKEEADGLNQFPNNNTAKLERKVHEGINHFNGYEALQYSRLRWIDSDFERIKRQRRVLIAIKESMKELSVSELKDVSEECLPYIQTNLSPMEIAGIILNLPGYMDNSIEQLTIPRRGTYRTLGHVDFKENTAILNRFLYQ